MPNHVHLLIDITSFDLWNVISHSGCTKNYPLTDSMRLLKGSTARLCNIILKRSVPFWHHESYDHYVRNERELFRIVQYMQNNPVKADLVRKKSEWKYFYLTNELSL
jgi:REP element-mobilizing transposase RayT